MSEKTRLIDKVHGGLWYMESWNYMARGPCIHEYFQSPEGMFSSGQHNNVHYHYQSIVDVCLSVIRVVTLAAFLMNMVDRLEKKLLCFYTCTRRSLYFGNKIYSSVYMYSHILCGCLQDFALNCPIGMKQ